MIKAALKKILPFHVASYLGYLSRKPDKVAEQTRTNLYKQFVSPGDVVFDVGANMGNRIQAFLNLNAKVIAVEPQIKCVKYLKLRFGKKITIINKGLGGEETVKQFFISDSHTLSTFSEDYIEAVQASGRFSQAHWDKAIEMKITTLDKLIEQYGVPAFIKIDVEGFEEEVLKGLSKKIRALSLEYGVPEQLEKALACIRSLNRTNPGIQFNYSVGESMQLEMSQWISATEMEQLVSSQKFINTGFGDIYAKNPN